MKAIYLDPQNVPWEVEVLFLDYAGLYVCYVPSTNEIWHCDRHRLDFLTLPSKGSGEPVVQPAQPGEQDNPSSADDKAEQKTK